MKYTFKTVSTNYIIWQTGLIPNFGRLSYHPEIAVMLKRIGQTQVDSCWPPKPLFYLVLVPTTIIMGVNIIS